MCSPMNSKKHLTELQTPQILKLKGISEKLLI